MESDGQLRALLKWAWPSGFGQADQLAYDRLSPASRLKLEARLSAIMRWSAAKEAGGVGPRLTATDAAQAAGVSRVHFHKLASDFAADRSLASLGLRASEPLRRTSAALAAPPDLSAAVARMLAEEPAIGVAEVERRLAAMSASVPSKTSLARLMADARRRGTAGLFGRRVIFDSPGMDLLDPEGYRLRLYVAIDDGTGLVLGRVSAGERWGPAGYVDAADQALEWLRDADLAGLPVSGDPVEIETRIGEWGDSAVEFFEGVDLAPAPDSYRERRLGRYAVQVLGDRLGRVWLGVGEREAGVGFRSGRKEHLPLITPSIEQSLDDAVTDHNSEILRRTASTSDPHRARLAVERVRRRLTEVSQLRDRILDDR